MSANIGEQTQDALADKRDATRREVEMASLQKLTQATNMRFEPSDIVESIVQTMPAAQVYARYPKELIQRSLDRRLKEMGR